jgi:BirA family biotin operon repressor/biotin-[acetyl-CoA-carboxylase] ligase
MNFRIIHIRETDSTNRWLSDLNEAEREDNIVVTTDFQTAGRGCGTNQWESMKGQNLLFSILAHPTAILARQQFAVSMMTALAITDALSKHADKGLSIKWPNDIYWYDRKLCGILIENRLSGNRLRESIIGVGLNVNQEAFFSDAPNPVSLFQITRQQTNRNRLLNELLDAFSRRLQECSKMLQEDSTAFYDNLNREYNRRLYRNKGFHAYRDKEGTFEAELLTVEDDGTLVLSDRDHRQRRYAFKEVAFII